MEEIFSACDIISVHTPLNDATRHLIDRALLSRIKEGALFVNTSRGAVVDESALEAELADGRFHAMLDVFEREPPIPQSTLYTLPNVTMMPHMGGPTIDMRQIIARELLIESAGFLKNGGETPSKITRKMASVMSLR
jgi:phosphoglycerate dehydrogenase-like enzyme